MNEHDFEVVREPLPLSDGIDTMHDAIVRADNRTVMGVVSRDYQLVKHVEAIDFVRSMFPAETYKTQEKIVSYAGGKRLDYTLTLPTMRALVVGEEFDPMITVRNSYDLSSSFSLWFGVKKLSCENGAYVTKRAYAVRLNHAYHNIEFDRIRQPVLTKLETVVSRLSDRLSQMGTKDGLAYLVPFIFESVVATKYKEAVLAVEEMRGKIEVVRDDQDRITEIKPTRDLLTAYVVWNALTFVATHKVEAMQVRRDIDAEIARLFF